jgi:hypothetical protein
VAQSESVRYGPPLPGELLAELFPLVGIVADVEEFMGDAVRGDDITLIVVKIL